eukprot:3866843-Pyramimonas_sp.AAC.1
MPARRGSGHVRRHVRLFARPPPSARAGWPAGGRAPGRLPGWAACRRRGGLRRAQSELAPRSCRGRHPGSA